MTEQKTQRWLYRGNTMLKDNTAGNEFESLHDDHRITGQTYVFSIKKIKLIPGGIYDIQTEKNGETTSIFASTLKFAGMHPDANLVAKVRADQLMFDERQREKKFVAKHSVVALPDDWQEIVALYRKIGYSDLLRFESLLIQKLRRAAGK